MSRALKNRLKKLESPLSPQQNLRARERLAQLDREFEKRVQEDPEGYERLLTVWEELQQALSEAGLDPTKLHSLDVLIHHPRADAAHERYLDEYERFLDGGLA